MGNLYKIMAPKDIYSLILRMVEYVNLYGKRDAVDI